MFSHQHIQNVPLNSDRLKVGYWWITIAQICCYYYNETNKSSHNEWLDHVIMEEKEKKIFKIAVSQDTSVYVKQRGKISFISIFKRFSYTKNLK